MSGLFSRLPRWWDWNITAAIEPEEREPASREAVPAAGEDLDGVWWRYA